MNYEEQLSFANLIYYPNRTLTKLKRNKVLIPGTTSGDAWYRETIERLIKFCRIAHSKYTRSKVRKKLPDDYGYAIDELINADDSIDKAKYYKGFVDAIIEIQAADDFIITMCNLIHLALAEHKPYVPGEENSPDIHITEVMPARLRVCDTDSGDEIKNRIADLCELIECYNLGLIKEK